MLRILLLFTVPFLVLTSAAVATPQLKYCEGTVQVFVEDDAAGVAMLDITGTKILGTQNTCEYSNCVPYYWNGSAFAQGGGSYRRAWILKADKELTAAAMTAASRYDSNNNKRTAYFAFRTEQAYGGSGTHDYYTCAVVSVWW